MRWIQRFNTPGFRLSEGDEILHRGRERLIELVLLATESDTHVDAPAEYPVVNPQDFLAMAYLIDVDTRLKAAEGAPGAARGNRALWRLAIDVLDDESAMPLLSFMKRDVQSACLIESMAIKNLEFLLDALTEGNPEFNVLSVPVVRALHSGRRIFRMQAATARLAFAAHDWPSDSTPFMAKPGGWDPLPRFAYRLFLMHHDMRTFPSVAGYYSGYLKHAQLWLAQPDFSRGQQGLLNRLRAGPVTREFDDVASEAAQRLVRTEIASRLAEIGLACRRYHMVKGRYPVALKELVPEFLEMTPWPPALVKYDATATGCVVYSEHTELHFRLGEVDQR